MMTSVYENLLDFEQTIDDVILGANVPVHFVPRSNVPAMSIIDHAHELVVTLDLPGVKKEDVKISKVGNLLTISGERKRASLPDGARWLRSETRDGGFKKTLELSGQIHGEGISAEMTNGVLRVVLPKAEEAKPREIAIR